MHIKVYFQLENAPFLSWAVLDGPLKQNSRDAFAFKNGFEATSAQNADIAKNVFI